MATKPSSRLDMAVKALPVTTIIATIAGRWRRVDPGDVTRAVELSGVTKIKSYTYVVFNIF